MKKISIAMIVKNEEGVIERCLQCISKFADEIVMIDTGSTDKTKSIAAAFPKVKVYDSEHFTKDTHYSDFRFGVARNESIRKCTGDWVIWWDADDQIDEKGAARIRELAETSRDRLYVFLIEHGGLYFEHCRMFPNGCGIFFDEEHGCHEYISITGGLPMVPVRDVVIRHAPAKKSGPSDRNLAILEKDHFKRGMNDSRTLFYLANTYREHGRHVEAAQFYDKYLAVSQWMEERFFARYYKSVSLTALGKLEEARQECFRAMAEDLRFAEPYCQIGEIHLMRDELDQAEAWFRLAMCIPFPAAKLFANQNCYERWPKYRLGEIEKKRKDVANHSYRQTLVFQLPEEKGDAVLAMVALQRCAEGNRLNSFRVKCSNDWQRRTLKGFLRLSEGEGQAAILEAPEKGKNALDWYARSAGFFLPDDVDHCAGPKLEGKVMICRFSGSEEIARILKNERYEVVEVAGGGSLDDAVESLKQTKVLIGVSSDWLQHLAREMRVPCIVMRNGSESIQWSEQENISADDGFPKVVEAFRRVSHASGTI